MIHIDRGRVKVPAILRSPRTGAAADKLRAFFEVPAKARAQRMPPFDQRIVGAREVREALTTLFHGKCAYCESRLEATAMSRSDVETFRPKIRAMNLDGTLFPDGYWWLAYEWNNMYSACQTCNRMKGPRFPVAGRGR